MPDVLAHLAEAERDAVANTLAQYLASLGTQVASALPEADAVERGRKLYESVSVRGVSLADKALPARCRSPVAEKYTVASLAEFLQDPLARGLVGGCRIATGTQRGGGDRELSAARAEDGAGNFSARRGACRAGESVLPSTAAMRVTARAKSLHRRR